MFHSLSKTFDRLRVISPSHDLYDTGNASTSTPPLVFGSRKTILDRYSRSKTHLLKIKSCLPSLYLTPTRVPLHPTGCFKDRNSLLNSESNTISHSIRSPSIFEQQRTIEEAAQQPKEDIGIMNLAFRAFPWRTLPGMRASAWN